MLRERERDRERQRETERGMYRKLTNSDQLRLRHEDHLVIVSSERLSKGFQLRRNLIMSRTQLSDLLPQRFTAPLQIIHGKFLPLKATVQMGHPKAHENT